MLTTVPGRQPRRIGPVWVATGSALGIGLLWAQMWAHPTGDLAAQRAWSGFAASHPSAAYDLAWYGGVSPASYSLLAPYAIALAGVRGTAVIALVVSSWLLSVVLGRAPLRHPRLVALWGAFALSCNVAAGRVPFALGIMFALAALAVGTAAGPVGWRRTGTCVVLALLATAASPLAGLFLEVAAGALLLRARWRIGWAFAVPPLLVVVTSALLFPSDGVDPITWPTVVYASGCALATTLLCPSSWRTVRLAAVGYTAGTVPPFAVPTPIGSNVGRLALVFASVVLLAALAHQGPHSRRRAAALAAAFAASAYWLVAADLLGQPPQSPPGQAAPLAAELRRLHADRTRLEAVPMLNHWEAWGLTQSAELARGWNRQVDVQRNPLFYTDALTGSDYHAWLLHWAVGYVALPSAPLDPAATTEAAVIKTRPAWLNEVWHDAYWQLYRVDDAVALADAPAKVQLADAADLVVTLPARATVRLRVAWSPWLTVTGPAPACLQRDGDWTSLHTTAAGTYRLAAPYTWPRGTPCHHHPAPAGK